MTTTIDKLKAQAAALDAQAAALRLAVQFLDQEARRGKHGMMDRLVIGAMALRQAQRNGARPHQEAPAPPARPATRATKRRGTSWSATLTRRKRKREQILAIVRAYGKPMPVAALATAARTQGLDSLTGISGSVRAGYLTKTGRKGKTVYSLGARAAR